MAPAGLLGMDAVELPHVLGEIAVGDVHQQMVVVGYQAPGVTDHIEIADHATKDFQERATVLIVVVADTLAPLAAREPVVQCTGEFGSQRSRHAETIAGSIAMMNDRSTNSLWS